MLRDRSIHTILYGMESNRETSWYRGTDKSQIFFSKSGTAYVYEPYVGFIAARSKHFHFEYSNEAHVEEDLGLDR